MQAHTGLELLYDPEQIEVWEEHFFLYYYHYDYWYYWYHWYDCHFFYDCCYCCYPYWYWLLFIIIVIITIITVMIDNYVMYIYIYIYICDILITAIVSTLGGALLPLRARGHLAPAPPGGAGEARHADRLRSYAYFAASLLNFMRCHYVQQYDRMTILLMFCLMFPHLAGQLSRSLLLGNGGTSVTTPFVPTPFL